MSDQDFFFDEEPEGKKTAKPAAKAPSAKPSARTTSPKAAAPAAPSVSAASSDQSATMAIAALVGVAALLLGAILGFLLGNTVGKSTVAAPKSTAIPTQTTGSTSSGQAGPLPAGVTTLPPGHPAVTVPTNTADATTTK